MRILVTGASGFLGSRCAEQLRSSGHEVIAPTHAECDWTDERAVKALFEHKQPEAVAHIAAIADIGECERDHERAFAVNVEATRRLCALAGSVPFVFISSDQVYNPMLCRPLTEDMDCGPQNYYGKTKVLGEEAVQKLEKSYCLRITWQFSAPHEAGFAKSTGILSVAEHALQTGTPVRVGAHSRRYVTCCWDTAHVVQLALEGKFAPGVYNVASRNHMTDGEAYAYVFRALGADEAQISRLVQADASFLPRSLTPEPDKLERQGIVLPEFTQSVQNALKGENTKSS